MPFPVAAALMGGSALMNFLGGQAEAQRRERLRRQLMELFSPGRLGIETNQLFDVLRSSPMYSGMRNQALTGASMLGNQLQASFAQRGLGRSGIAGMALPIARASFAPAFANIDASLFSKALSEARQGITSRAAALTGTQGPSGFEAGLGGWLESMQPYLLELLKKYGMGSSTMTGGAGLPFRSLAGASDYNYTSGLGPRY